MPTPTPSAAESEAPGWGGPQTKQGWPPAPSASAEESGRRDTPTEMYVKGVHGTPEEAPEPAATGDRDTPTRAYSVEGPGRLMTATLKSPVGLDTPVSEDNSTTIDLFSSMPTNPQARREAMMTMPIPKQVVPLGAILRAMPPQPAPQPAPVAPPPSSMMVSPFKPAWQVSIDRGLIAVGRTSESLARRFKEAPQNTQIIVVIVAATGAILILGFLVFLTVH
jgi:hypothetical protein